ncbi:MAG: MFS transporter [Sphingobium sp.]|nr:MFS transporter [Sphingobium sp.]MBP8670476.1 MFS transporter [Sphingobium sp.]MBP9156911.1 MFS transporter [Sphingobium sp.]
MQWLTVGVLFILYIRSLADRYLIALLVEPIKADTGMSDFQISLLQGGAFAVLYCVCAIPVGLALDRFSRRWVLFACVALWSLGAAGCGLVGSFATLAVMRSLVGAGEAGFSTGAYSIVGDSFPLQRVSFAMSIFVMGGVMGAGIVFLLGGPLVNIILNGGVSHWPGMGGFAPWQQAFIVTGVPGVLMAFLVFLFREPPRRRAASPSRQGAGYGEALRFIHQHWKVYTSIFMGFGLAYTSTIGLQLWLPAFFSRTHGWAPKEIGFFLGIAQIVAALSLPVHGWVVDALYKRGRHDAHLLWCMVTVCLAIPFGVAIVLVSNPWIAVVCFGLYMTCILSTASMGPAATQIVTPQELRGRASAIYVLFTGLIGMTVGPGMVGWITDSILGDPSKIGVSLLILVVSILSLVVFIFAFGRAQMRHLMQMSQTAPA